MESSLSRAEAAIQQYLLKDIRGGAGTATNSTRRRKLLLFAAQEMPKNAPNASIGSGGRVLFLQQACAKDAIVWGKRASRALSTMIGG